MMEPVFVQCGETILYLVSGRKDALKECAGEGFTFLDSSKSEGAGEKHLPDVIKDGQKITVRVGSVLHPMTEEHSISWIYLETKQGGQFAKLSPDREPVAEFMLAQGDEAVAAYAYCNLHGFWKTDIR